MVFILPPAPSILEGELHLLSHFWNTLCPQGPQEYDSIE